ncbi:MAG: GHMP kinase [Armatimonadota bacterium]
MFRSKAPLRISFAGGGTDVSPYLEERGGVVLSTTIDKFAYASVGLNEGSEITVTSLDYDVVAKYHADKAFVYDGELDIVKGAIDHYGNGRGLDLFLHSDAPPGSGLGSSSTMVVALLGALAALNRTPLSTYEMAQLAYKIERQDLGIKGGMQDQYAAAFGGFNFIEFSEGAVIVNPLRIAPETLNELEYNLLLCYTGKTRPSANILQRQINASASHQDEVIKSLDHSKVIATEMKNFLLRGKLREFGELLHVAWEEKKKLDSQISNSQIDELYAAGRNAGAIGGKVLGAGGGGYLLFYCEFTKKHKVAEALEKVGGQVVDFRFEPHGVQSWEVRA